MIKKCPLCDSDQFKVLYDLRNPAIHADVGLPGIIKKCSNCSLIYKDFNKEISDVYDDSYADTFLGLEEYAENDVSKMFFKNILSKSRSRIKGNGKPVLLDVGSGVGTLLDIAGEIGFYPKGVELSSKLAGKAIEKGHQVFNCNISEINDSEKFEVISMMDIIEHLETPKEVLVNLKRKLSPNGEVIVYTPNHDSLIVKIAHIMYKMGFKSGVENIFACTHTCFFTSETLKKILIQSGFKIIECNEFKYNTDRPGQKVSMTEKLFINIIENLGSLMGTKGFRVVIYASKN